MSLNTCFSLYQGYDWPVRPAHVRGRIKGLSYWETHYRAHLCTGYLAQCIHCVTGNVYDHWQGPYTISNLDPCYSELNILGPNAACLITYEDNQGLIYSE